MNWAELADGHQHEKKNDTGHRHHSYGKRALQIKSKEILDDLVFCIDNILKIELLVTHCAEVIEGQKFVRDH